MANMTYHVQSIENHDRKLGDTGLSLLPTNRQKAICCLSICLLGRHNQSLLGAL